MDFFNTVKGQALMENISHQLTRIANALVALAAANGTPASEEKEKKV